MKCVEICKDVNEYYGLKDKETNNLIIPYCYQEEYLQDILYLKEIERGIYLCLKSDNINDIVGLYDNNHHELFKSINNSYLIYKNVVILKNKELTTKGSTLNRKINSKTSISLYDFKFGNFITSPNMYGLSGENLDSLSSRKFIDDGIEIKNDIIFFGKDNSFYDIKSGKLYKNYKFYNKENGNFLVFNLGFNKIDVGMFDIFERRLIKCQETPIRNLYLLDNHKYIYFDSYKEEIVIPKEYSDFYVFNKCYEVVLFSKDFKIIKRYEKMSSNIRELSYEEAIELEISKISKTNTYLIDGKFYEYTDKKYPFSDNKDYPFREFKNETLFCYETLYGYGLIGANSLMELDYIIESLDKEKENIESKLLSLYNSTKDLQDSYPKLVKKK